MDDRFKDHPTYGEYFAVSEDGQVFSKRTSRLLKFCISDSGYLVFATRFEGRKGPCKRLIVHRLVAETYIPNIGNKPYVNHKDGAKLNNHVSNLEWVTGSENVRHAMALGLLDISKIDGANNPGAKLTEQQVREIRSNTTNSDKELSIIYSMSRPSIWYVRNGITYKNVKP